MGKQEKYGGGGGCGNQKKCGGAGGEKSKEMWRFGGAE